MLRHKADWRSLAYMAVTTTLLIVQWSIGYVHPILYPLSLFMAVSVAVMAHNHNHLPMWRSKPMNVLTDYWLTLFYGFPAFAFIAGKIFRGNRTRLRIRQAREVSEIHSQSIEAHS